MSVKSADLIRKRLTDDDPEKRLVVSPILDPQTQLRPGEASIDLRLGVRFTVSRRGKLGEVDTNDPGFDVLFASVQDTYYVPIGSSFVLHPNHFALGETLEYIKMPSDLMGYVVTRSSWGRHGLVIATAIGVHPDYSGVLTLELRNLADVPLRLYPGRRVLQLFLHQFESASGERRLTPSAYEGGTRPGAGLFAREANEMEAISRFADLERHPFRQ